MTGLAPTDVLLEISCFVTDAQLNLLDTEGFHTVIGRSESTLDEMDDWCTNTHTSSGLVSRVLASTVTPTQAGAALLSYIQKYVPEKCVGLLAGNTVHADKVFLVKEMPAVVEWLGYRIVDVSSVKEMGRRWCGEEVLAKCPRKEGVHRSKEDVLESIEEARYWKGVLFDGK